MSANSDSSSNPSPPSNPGRKGTALVTGAAGIVGPAICSELRRQGWKVCATDRDISDFGLAVELQFSEPFWDLQVACDLSTKTACKELVGQAERELGPVNLLVNNAALPYRVPSFHDYEEERALDVFRVNTLAPLWLTAAAEPSLAATSGAVVNISTAQTQAWQADNHLYVASKAALESLTLTMSAVLRPKGVSCFGLRLGCFPGNHFMRDLLRQLPREAARSLHDDLMERHLDLARSVYGGESVGDPCDLAQFIGYLASPAGRMLHGSLLDFDGGYSSRPLPLHGPTQSRQWAEEWMARWRSETPAGAKRE